MDTTAIPMTPAKRAQRDRNIYEMARTDRLSSAAIARRVGLSVMRVNQILRAQAFTCRAGGG